MRPRSGEPCLMDILNLQGTNTPNIASLSHFSFIIKNYKNKFRNHENEGRDIGLMTDGTFVK